MIVLALSAVALLASCIAIYLYVIARRAVAECRKLLVMVEEAQRDAMNAEARARGVGGRGEHATTIISPIVRQTQSVMVKREGRLGIPRIVPRIEL